MSFDRVALIDCIHATYLLVRRKYIGECFRLKVSHFYKKMILYSRLSLSRPRLSRITAYLEVKI